MDTLMMIFTSGTSGEPKAVQVRAPDGAVLRGSTWSSGSRSPPTTSATSRCRCSTPTPWSPAGRSRSARARRWCRRRFSASRFLSDVRRYGATYLNYVGKPLAYILATPEQPDDADNPLRVAFGNEASDRDIEEFARRFGCHVMDGFGSTENAVIITRAAGHPARLDRPGRRRRSRSTTPRRSQECAVAEFDEHGRAGQRRRGDRRAGQHRGRRLLPGLLQRRGRQRRADAARHVLVAATSPTATQDGWIYLAGRTADWMRVDGENLAAAPIERIIQRLPAVALVGGVRRARTPHVGDQVMAALVLQDDASLDPDRARRLPGEPGRTCRPRAGRATCGSPRRSRRPRPTRCSSAS